MTDASQPPLEVIQLETGAIGTNCFIVRDAGTGDAVIVDPGADPDRILSAVPDGSTIHAILVTHVHWDHIGAVADVARATKAPVHISDLEAGVLADPAGTYPDGIGPIEGWKAEVTLTGGERLAFGALAFDVVHMPGHSPGTMGFVCQAPGSPAVALVGDVVFAGSVGRVDLPFADGPTLANTIRQMLDTWDDETVLLPGHGPATTLGREKESNPFLRQPEILAQGT